MEILKLLFLIPVIALGTFLGTSLHIRYSRWSMSKCNTCRTKIDLPPMMLAGSTCPDCQKKYMEEMEARHTGEYPSAPIPLDDMARQVFADPQFVEDIKSVYKDPETVKLMRKAFGFQSERERFEEEAEEEHGL
jgi:hypothetical protein